jgi:hypothetical protein
MLIIYATANTDCVGATVNKVLVVPTQFTSPFCDTFCMTWLSTDIAFGAVVHVKVRLEPSTAPVRGDWKPEEELPDADTSNLPVVGSTRNIRRS